VYGFQLENKDFEHPYRRQKELVLTSSARSHHWTYIYYDKGYQGVDYSVGEQL